MSFFNQPEDLKHGFTIVTRLTSPSRSTVFDVTCPTRRWPPLGWDRTSVAFRRGGSSQVSGGCGSGSGPVTSFSSRAMGTSLHRPRFSGRFIVRAWPVISGRSIVRTGRPGSTSISWTVPCDRRFGYAALNDAVGYAPNAVPLGFRILDEARSEAVLARFPQLVVAGATSPEIVEAEQAIARAAGKAKGGGQGFQLSPAARTAIEHHAMDRVQQYYEGLGWKAARVQVDRPYDLLCTKGDQKLHVEVKGTMSPGVKVVVTAGEVRHAQQGSVSIALAVVSRITLQSVSHGKTTATSGTLRVQHPWNIDPERLEPIGYFYRRLPMEMERAVDSELDVGSVRSHHVAPSP